MNDDKFLHDLMAEYKPQLSSDDAFMETFERRLKLIEYVKTCQQAERQKNRRDARSTFAVGLVLGSVLTVVALLMPNPTEGLLIGVKSKVLIMLLENVHYILLFVCAIIIWGGLLLLLKTRVHRPQQRMFCCSGTERILPTVDRRYPHR